ncbi:VOC family protein [Streptomyces sp. NPDC002812]|uniref:VOC family protein n=1 Tax=unclassified Streptomyces TaxID=2593676 RepID=UPI002030F3A7|nr:MULTISPECIES: VOC family protein [unclassified Streptomyces]MCM1969106.1 VOC family protein [Streptomyces sp. G1]MCX5124476.1 VOC family protein [Streptomyces sp. NBC_00347]MCX5297721.1 VOC family protein [Streptomyces sp. NBC_00193]
MAAFAEGSPCWVDASLPDVEAGKRFYGELFGWTFSEGAGPEYGHYTQAYSRGRNVAALAPKPDGRMPTVWGIYLYTTDAYACAQRIRAAGGQMVMDPMPVGPYGTAAMAADPGGAVFGLWQPGTHHGFDAQNEPYTYCWSEVYTRARDAVDVFYAKVFGYVPEDQNDDESGIEYRVWSPPGKAPGSETAVLGRSLITDAFPEIMPAHFLAYFAVPDCDQSVAMVQRLGGRVTADPFDTPYGRIAVVADNQGAVFGLLSEPRTRTGTP